MRARWIAGIAIAVLLVGGGTAYWKSSRNGTALAATARYVTEPVRRGTLRVEVSGTGLVVGQSQANVRAEVAGTVRAVRADVGDRVKQGDPLVELTSDDLRDQVAQTRLDLQMAELKLQDMRNPTKKAAAGEVELARQRVEQARLALESRRADEANLAVTATGAGEVARVAVHTGDTVSAGALIAELETTDRLAFILPVRESSIAHLKVGQKARMTIGSRDLARNGIIREIPTQGVQSADGFVFNVKIEILPDLLGVVRPGMTGYAIIDTRPDGEYIIEGKGTVEPWDRFEVRALTSGRVQQLLIEQGNRVEKGQVVARLANENLPVQIRQAEADLKSAELNLQNLVAPQSTATESEIRQQELRVEQLRLTLAQKERDLAKLTVRSPIDGTVIQRNVNPGDRVTAGGSGDPLFVVADYSKMSVQIDMDELDVGKLREGLEAQITIEALPGRSFRGTVTQISPSGKVSQGVATFGVLVEFQPSPQVLPGMTASVRILVDERKDVLTVPLEAVQRQRGKSFVRRLPVPPPGQADQAGGAQPSSAPGRRPPAAAMPELVEVQTGIASDAQIEILSGLKEGDVVVVGEVSQPAVRGGIPGFGGPGGGPARVFTPGGGPGGGRPGGGGGGGGAGGGRGR